MRRFFYIFLILNLTILVSVFARESTGQRYLPAIEKIFKFIKEKLSSGYTFDNSLRDQVIQKTASIVGFNNFDKQYRLLRIAMKKGSEFSNSYEFLRNSPNKVYELLNGASQEIKAKHPDKIYHENTTMTMTMDSRVSTNVSAITNKTEVNDILNEGCESDVFASSIIEVDAVKPKQDRDDYEKLKGDNERLRAQNNLLSKLSENFKKERSEFMDKQMELSTENGGLRAENSGLKAENSGLRGENGGLKAENSGLKERVVNLERQVQDLERLKSLNELYKQVVEIYQKITKSRLDFKQIIELMKQIEGKRSEK